MTSFPLTFTRGRFFVGLEGQLWLLGTGSLTSFGKVKSLHFCKETFRLSSKYLGLTAESLSQQLGIECAGLLGADILNQFDHVLDTPGGKIIVSSHELPLFGQCLRIDDFMGIPIVTSLINSREYRMLFDTGTELSYLADESITRFPSTGAVSDFYPGYGPFQTNTHSVPLQLGSLTCVSRFGFAPKILGSLLEMKQVQGILGNQLLLDRVLAYYPRRGMLCV